MCDSGASTSVTSSGCSERISDEARDLAVFDTLVSLFLARVALAAGDAPPRTYRANAPAGL